MGLGNLVEEREKTNRALIDFYRKMYEDLQPETSGRFDGYISQLISAINGCGEDEEEKLDILSDSLHIILDYATNN